MRDVLDTGSAARFELKIEADDEIWPIKVDPAEFETALVNLVINARDAMPQGGTVTVSASNIVIDDGDHQGRFCRHQGQGHRRRHSRRRACEDIRSVLYDQSRLARARVSGFRRSTALRIRRAARSGSRANWAKARRSSLCLPRSAAALAGRPGRRQDARATGTVLLVEDNPDVAIAIHRSAGRTRLRGSLGVGCRRALSAKSPPMASTLFSAIS